MFVWSSGASAITLECTHRWTTPQIPISESCPLLSLARIRCPWYEMRVQQLHVRSTSVQIQRVYASRAPDVMRLLVPQEPLALLFCTKHRQRKVMLAAVASGSWKCKDFSRTDHRSDTILVAITSTLMTRTAVDNEASRHFNEFHLTAMRIWRKIAPRPPHCMFHRTNYSLREAVLAFYILYAICGVWLRNK